MLLRSLFITIHKTIYVTGTGLFNFRGYHKASKYIDNMSNYSQCTIDIHSAWDVFISCLYRALGPTCLFIIIVSIWSIWHSMTSSQWSNLIQCGTMITIHSSPWTIQQNNHWWSIDHHENHPWITKITNHMITSIIHIYIYIFIHIIYIYIYIYSYAVVIHYPSSFLPMDPSWNTTWVATLRLTSRPPQFSSPKKHVLPEKVRLDPCIP